MAKKAESVAPPDTLIPEEAGTVPRTGARRSGEERTDVAEPQLLRISDVLNEPQADVLVVEDDENDLWIIDRAIRRHGMESRFRIVRSGEEALAYLHETVRRPKVVLLDLKLTGIDGQEVLRRIRQDDRLCTLPIVIVSSSRNESDVCECYRLGANSFVSSKQDLEHPGDHVIEIAHYWLDLNRTAPAI